MQGTKLSLPDHISPSLPYFPSLSHNIWFCILITPCVLQVHCMPQAKTKAISEWPITLHRFKRWLETEMKSWKIKKGNENNKWSVNKNTICSSRSVEHKFTSHYRCWETWLLPNKFPTAFTVYGLHQRKVKLCAYEHLPRRKQKANYLKQGQRGKQRDENREKGVETKWLGSRSVIKRSYLEDWISNRNQTKREKETKQKPSKSKLKTKNKSYS